MGTDILADLKAWLKQLARDQWHEDALDCTVRAQQTDDERTYTAVTKLRNSWIRVANNLEFIDFIPADHGSPKRALARYQDVDRTGSRAADGHRTIMLICWSRLDQCELLKRTSSNASR